MYYRSGFPKDQIPLKSSTFPPNQAQNAPTELSHRYQHPYVTKYNRLLLSEAHQPRLTTYLPTHYMANMDSVFKSSTVLQ